MCGTRIQLQASFIVVSSGKGAAPADISSAIAVFRTSIGGGTVAGANGSFGGVRREINWDGVADNFSDPNPLPAQFFQCEFSSRDPIQHGRHDMNVDFFLAGTDIPASTSAFGVVFVDNTQSSFPGCASIQLFDGATSLGFSCAPVAPSGGLSFLGLAAPPGNTITRVSIHLGTGLLGTTQSSTNEVVVMDDFIFAEPAGGVPEPGTISLLAAGVLGGIALRRRRSC